MPTSERGERGGRAGRRAVRTALCAATALLALHLATAAHHARPDPYGDRLTLHTPADAALPAAGHPRLRLTTRAVEAYDRRSGTRIWTYARQGRRPLTAVTAPGHFVALWDDGMITAIGRNGSTVRWHRAVADAADWLARPAARRGAGVLRPLDPRARMLAVVTPQRIAAYRSADGDLRWVLPAWPGCAFVPGQVVRRGAVLLVAQPCAGGPRSDGADGSGGTDPRLGLTDGSDPAWTAELIAVDSLGRITPRRTPLGNEVRPDHPR